MKNHGIASKNEFFYIYKFVLDEYPLNVHCKNTEASMHPN